MKYYLDGILVVEGKEDESYLSSFIDTHFVLTNGYEIPEKELKFLQKAIISKKIYVLLDPDEAGRTIEKKIKKSIPQATYISIDINMCTRGKKNGVAECLNEEILKVLSPYFSTKGTSINSQITYNDLYPLNRQLRSYISEKYSLGICNNKTLIERINMLEIDINEIKKTIKEYQDGNK